MKLLRKYTNFITHICGRNCYVCKSMYWHVLYIHTRHLPVCVTVCRQTASRRCVSIMLWWHHRLTDQMWWRHGRLLQWWPPLMVHCPVVQMMRSFRGQCIHLPVHLFTHCKQYAMFSHIMCVCICMYVCMYVCMIIHTNVIM